MRAPAICVAALVLLNVALNTPLFQPGETPYRGSIEGGYAAMSRFFAEHPNPWGWNPLQYCGLPSQFTYLPALHYLAAAAMHLFPHTEPYYVYRIVTAIFACLAPGILCYFVFFFTRSWPWALAAGTAYSVFSPLYGLLHVVEKDRGVVDLPWRLQVLVKYGEGPHTVGMALIPLALVAVWAAGTSNRYRQTFAAAVMLALVALTHWIAALALAFCCVMLLLTVAGRSELVEFRMSRVFIAGFMACLFACFWLTPSFIRTIAFNWPTDAFNYHLQQQQKWLFVGLAVGLVAVRLAFQKFPGQLYLCFLILCAFGFGYIVIFFDAYRLDTIPESRRYMLEFEAFLLLAVVECFRLALGNRKDPGVRYCAAVSGVLVLLAGLGQAEQRFAHNWENWRTVPKEQTIEYRLAKWMADQHSKGRIFASGGLRYRLNAWFDLPQIGGTFESGLRDRVVLDYDYKIRNDIVSPAETLRMLQAMGVEYLVVHGPGSAEYYRDFKNPSRFDGFLERAYAEEHDVIYRVPLPVPIPLKWDAGGTAEQKGMAAISVVAWLLAIGALFLPW